MKSIVVIYESAADLPQQELDGRTPLEVARCPAATRMVSEGWGGVLARGPARAPKTAGQRLAAFCGLPESTAALAARGPLEAAALEIDLSGYTHAYRGEFVTVDDGRLRDGQLVRLTLQETEQLAQAVQQVFDPARVKLVAHAPGRVAVLVRSESGELAPGNAPWLLEGEDVFTPSGRGQGLLAEMLEKSAQVLARLTLNEVRVDLGENPASALWLWGGGPLARLHSETPARTLVLTQSKMAAGLARWLGFPVEPLLDPWAAARPGGVVDPDRLRAELSAYDRMVVYVEAPPELYRGPAREKVRLLERMDILLTQPLFDVFKRFKQRRFALVSVEAAVPEDESQRAPHLVAVWGSHLDPDAVSHWDEPSCRGGRLAGASSEDVARLMIGE